MQSWIFKVWGQEVATEVLKWLPRGIPDQMRLSSSSC